MTTMLECLTENERAAFNAVTNLALNDLQVTSEGLAYQLDIDKPTAGRRLRALCMKGLILDDGGMSSCGWFKTWKVTNLGWLVLREMYPPEDGR